MTLYQEKFRAESSRLRGWDYRSRGWYFVTICAANHACIFGEVKNGGLRLSLIGEIAESELQALAFHYDNAQIVEHVVMPNHVHAIVMIDGEHRFSPTATMSLGPLQVAELGVATGWFSLRDRSFLQGRCDAEMSRPGPDPNDLAVSLP